MMADKRFNSGSMLRTMRFSVLDGPSDESGSEKIGNGPAGRKGPRLREQYERLRALVSPVVAVTTCRDGALNGLIVNSALRASLSPEKLRISIIVHKFNHSHDMIFDSGVFTAHLLRPSQISLVIRFGCASGRDGDKLTGLAYRLGRTGAPVLDECHTYYECRVVNAMDTGGSTIFLGAVDSAGGPGGPELMSSAHVRAGIPTDSGPQYQADLERGQRFATEMADRMRPLVWRDLVADQPTCRRNGADDPAWIVDECPGRDWVR
jgi:flavin reductase (DIM6/NTAB) family NADH-FMN oxidoreductase RutF